MNLFKRIFGTNREEPSQRVMSAQSFGNIFPLPQAVYGPEREVLGIPSALCAVRVIAEAFADCPVEIIETVGDEKRVVKDHELAYRLNVEANDDVSAVDFKKTAIHHLLLWGNTFSEIVFNGAGQFESFKTLLPNYTQVQRNEDNNLQYLTTLYPQMTTTVLPSYEVLHIKNLSYDGLVGIAPIQYCRLAFDLAHDQESYGSNWFKNNSKPGGFYKFPNALSQQARDNIIKSHREQFAGSRNANSVGILDAGGDFQATVIPADDGQFLNSRMFQLVEIARIFNLSPVFLHDLGRATWSNLETLNSQFAQRTLVPWLHSWELELKRKVLGRRSNLSVHFNVSGLLRGDIATRFQVYSTGLQNGIYNVNECRRQEGLPSIGPEGDVYRVQLNMSATDADGKDIPAAPIIENINEQEGETENESI